MRYFKVTDPQMRSLFFDYYHGKGIQYELNKMVRPVVGKLFCYSLEHLAPYGFVECNRDSISERRLFECECLQPIKRKVKVKQPCSLDSNDIGKTWNADYRFGHYYIDTITAQGIKLVRELDIVDLETLIRENTCDILR